MSTHETKADKMRRQFLSLGDQVATVTRENEIFNIAIKIALFEKENEGVFIENSNPRINNGQNYTCSFLTRSLYDNLDIKRSKLPQEDLDTEYLLAQVNKNNSPKIIIKK